MPVQSPYWECNECGEKMNKLNIQWGICSGQKVDILDYFCLHCPSTELTFQGTKKEKDAWWGKQWEDES